MKHHCHTAGHNTLPRLPVRTDLPSNLIVFDATCLMCSGFACFVALRDNKTKFKFVSAQSELGKDLYSIHGLDPDQMETSIVIHDGRAFVKMAAFCQAMSALGWPWRLFKALKLFPRPFADWFYDRIAPNRYRAGRRSCPLPSDALRNRLVD